MRIRKSEWENVDTDDKKQSALFISVSDPPAGKKSKAPGSNAQKHSRVRAVFLLQ